LKTNRNWVQWSPALLAAYLSGQVSPESTHKIKASAAGIAVTPSVTVTNNLRTFFIYPLVRLNASQTADRHERKTP